MDMSWQALLQEAAATSIEKTADTLAATENDNCACVDLREQQIHELSKKILLLPHQGSVLLLSRYCFRLSPEETEMFFHLENAKGRFRFYKELLPSLEQVSNMEDEAQLNSYITDFTKQELTAAWGEPTESSSMEDVWYINENTKLVINYHNNDDHAVICSIVRN